MRGENIVKKIKKNKNNQTVERAVVVFWTSCFSNHHIISFYLFKYAGIVYSATDEFIPSL